MPDQKIVDAVKEYIALIPQEMGLKKAYIFGSFAKGTEREESDIDVAIVLSEMTDFFETQRQLMQLRRRVDLRLEPHPISTDDFSPDNPLAYEILQTGVAII